MNGEASAYGTAGLWRAKRLISGLSIVIFPVMLLFGFVTHPDIFSLEMVTDLDPWIAEWRGNLMFHVGHLLVMFAVPFIFVATIRLTSLLHADGAWYGLIGAILAVFGAFMLAVDKGALTFVLTAFMNMPEAQFAAIKPALEAIFQRQGWLWITWGFVALPIGFVLITIGLIKEQIVPRWQGICTIVGLVLLINPDIEIISSTGAALMCIGLIPLGLKDMIGSLG
ncbi:MAG: hypothetical protein GY798_22590 [Hyphomicrobiales bacterium]|nr:hypothetical protein [Hyphomicrobiales bacterium]